MADLSSRKLKWRDQSLEFLIENDRIPSRFAGPDPLSYSELQGKVSNEIFSSGDKVPFALRDLIIGGDRIVIPVNGGSKQLFAPLNELISNFEQSGVSKSDITILSTPEFKSYWDENSDLKVNAVAHKPEDEQERAYLASTSDETRIYLNRNLLDHDIVIPLMVTEPNCKGASLGYLSQIWPFFSDSQSISSIQTKHRKARQSVRRTIREAIWLSGLHLVIAAIPSATGIASIKIYQPEFMQHELNQEINQKWRFLLKNEIQQVILLTGLNDEMPMEEADFEQFARTVARVSRYTDKLAIVAELSPRMIEKVESLSPTELKLQPWYQSLSIAASRCKTYILSNLSDETSDDIELISLESAIELERLVRSGPAWAMVECANRARIVFD